jgi:hypothetical protein
MTVQATKNDPYNRSHNEPIARLRSIWLGDEGFDPHSAGLQLHDCRTSRHRKIALQSATGGFHPDHFGRELEPTQP